MNVVMANHLPLLDFADLSGQILLGSKRSLTQQIRVSAETF